MTFLGDSCHGNPHIATPHLDAMHAAGARHSTPGGPCARRHARLDDRSVHRTRVIDTYCGRSMLEPRSQPLRDCLAAGMQTGYFGKWHLGDTPPMRHGTGHTETLVHQAGGIGQPGDLWKTTTAKRKLISTQYYKGKKNKQPDTVLIYFLMRQLNCSKQQANGNNFRLLGDKCTA